MFTPQEVKEKTFVKAVFGGYDMQGVDDFLEPLTADYAALYKENAELKDKLRVLVRKLEELRDMEQAKPAPAPAADSDTLLQDTKRQCDAMLAEARRQAKQLCSDTLIEQETQRIACAKQAALNFIQVIERDIQGHVALLEKLKTEDLAEEDMSRFRSAKSKPQAYDYERETPREIADQIDDNLQKMGITEAEEPAKKPEDDFPTARFSDLKFGSNYAPTE